MNSKYKMFKNYMYNDLGITKQDIEDWTKEAVKEIALKHLENHISEYDVRRWVQGRINEFLASMITDAVIKDFLKRISVNVYTEKAKGEA